MSVTAFINPVVLNNRRFPLRALLNAWYAGGWLARPVAVSELQAQAQKLPNNELLRLSLLPPPRHGLTKQATAPQAKETHIIVGGDGTLHLVLNQLGLDRLNTATLMVIPGGTGNDFARSLGIPLDPLAAWEQLSAGTLTPVDVGVLNNATLFACACSFGFGAEVTRRATRPARYYLGKHAFAWGALCYLLNPEKPRHKMKLSLHGYRRSITSQHLVVGNGRTHGGGIPMTPSASPQSGCLDIYRVKPLKRWEPWYLLGRSVAGRDHTSYHKKVVTYRLPEVTLSLNCAMDVDIDGELYQLPEGEVSMRVIPGGLLAWVPSQASAVCPPASA
jgi:diacylglycerol kinase family enzyme